jgi:hypothetical protein
MADLQAQRIVDTALRLRHQNRATPALDIVDQAMQGQHGSAPDFSVIHPEYDDYADPASKFGELLRQAFAPRLDELCDERAQERWQTEVIDAFAHRYALWKF